jgi:general secretion pathway protein B
MSYIPDALKKAEQKRDQEQLLSKLTFSGKLPTERKKRSFWPYLLLAALLLNTVVIAFLVGSPWSDKGGTIAQGPVLLQPAQTAITEGKNRVRETLKDSKEAPQKKDVIGSSSRIVEKEARETAVPVPAKVLATEGTPTEQRPGQGKRAAPSIDRLYSLSELPLAVKSDLPEFRVSGHAYSPDRHTRVTRVNEKILQEGQELTPGLRVEEIIPAGIIFSYQGYRFSVRTSENR